MEANRDHAERLALIVPGRDKPVAPTHWSFGQLCTLVGAPTSYLRQLPAALSDINLQHGLLSHRAELVKTLEADSGRVELRAVTGPGHGRIWDHEPVATVMKIASNGTGETTRWKVPGVNPMVDVTTTTLYASDRDVFLFLVDDTNLIEAGRLRDGSPAVIPVTTSCLVLHTSANSAIRYGAPRFLAAYNAGPGSYESHLATERPPPDETQASVTMLAPMIDRARPNVQLGVVSKSFAWANSMFAPRSAGIPPDGRPSADMRQNHSSRARGIVDLSALVPHSGNLFVHPTDEMRSR